MAPNPKGSIDRDLRLVAFWRGDDLLAILWGVSCHPVSFPEGTLASACFPGRVREAIRGALGHDIPVLFAQGFSGDVRPASYSRRIPKSPKGLANFVRAGGALFAPMTMNRYDMWCSALAGHAHEALRRARTSGRNPVQVRRRDSQITSPPGWRRDPRLTRLDLSSNVSLIASNAEIVSERVKDLVAAGGTRTFLPVGCCDAVIGYWPTDKMRRQGGYEGRQSQCNFPALDWDSVGGADKAWRSLLSAVMSET